MAPCSEPCFIEPMRRADLESVAAIDRACFPTPWLPGAYDVELENTSAFYFTARTGNVPVGYAGAWVIRSDAHITTLAVMPPARRRGIGERLLVALLEEICFRGASHITLEVRAGNRSAQRLYEKYGFRAVSTLRGYYTDNHEDAVVMWADDVHTTTYARCLEERKRCLASQTVDASRPATVDASRPATVDASRPVTVEEPARNR